jgi:3-hydroxybutyryl-CoA dehydrogenase
MTRVTKSERIAVVGLGLLGRGIAARFLGCGFEVVALDHSEVQHASAREQIGRMIDELIDIGGFGASLREEWSARYIPTASPGLLKDCSFVVESVTEDPTVKEETLDGIESVIAATTVIASNTSAIPISQLQQRRKHPERLVGMHWAAPAHATRFMELIRGDQTSDAAFETAAALARRLGKDPCLCQKDVPAFLVNRIGYAMYREALHLLETGVADAETIDRAVRNALGLWATVCGPFRWIDLTGGPEGYAKAMDRVLPTLSKADEVPPVMRKLAESGARGIANGRGFFAYTPEEAHHWEELYRRHAWRVTHMQEEYFPLSAEPKQLED